MLDEAATERALLEALAAAGEPADREGAEPAPSSRLLAAAEAGDLAALKELLTSAEVAPDGINTVGEDGDTCLHIASLYGHPAIVQEALALGADPAALDEDGSTALHDASASGHADIVTMLLAKGASVLVQDGDGDTPLHLACNGGHAAVAALLLQADGGAQAAQTANALGQTPASLAAEPALAELCGAGGQPA